MAPAKLNCSSGGNVVDSTSHRTRVSAEYYPDAPEKSKPMLGSEINAMYTTLPMILTFHAYVHYVLKWGCFLK